MKDVLSPFPYYGGKAHMATLIADMLDYDNTEIYIEPFGGAARTLLNKPPHPLEIYCDTSRGLCSFFEVVQNPHMRNELQERLIQFEPSNTAFIEKVMYKMSLDESTLENIGRLLASYVWNMRKKYVESDTRQKITKLRQDIFCRRIDEIVGDIENLSDCKISADDKDILNDSGCFYKSYWEFGEKLYKNQYDMVIGGVRNPSKELEQEARNSAFSLLESEETPLEICEDEKIELAMATFITFFFSRDGMGLTYSENRGNNLKAYEKKIIQLDEIGERMADVRICNVNAMYFLYKEMAYIENQNVMMYLDPSYLRENEESGIRKKENNCGTCYHSSFTKEQHEELLNTIKDAKAKILISNYDVATYRDILEKESKWQRYEYETKTTVGGAKNAYRTEVLWYNY